MLIAFGILAALMLAASFRTSMVTVLGLSLLTVTLFVLAIGNYSASATTVKAGGWLGIVLAAVAFYLALAAVGQASTDGRSCGSGTSQRSRNQKQSSSRTPGQTARLRPWPSPSCLVLRGRPG